MGATGGASGSEGQRHGRLIVSRVLAQALAAAVDRGCGAAVADTQLVLWQCGQLALLGEVVVEMAVEGRVGVAAALAWLLVQVML